MLIAPVAAFAVSGQPTITVDGQLFERTHQSGPTDHYETPTPNPVSAFTARHTWDGVHGAEHLPCVGGIHWIDNANLLTISHCLDGSTTTTVPETTTTTVPETTTTVPETTTTVPDTTTTVPETTTTVPDTTTTVPETTTTTVSETTTTAVPETTTTAAVTTTTQPTLPRTGANLAVLAIIGISLIGMGVSALRTSR